MINGQKIWTTLAQYADWIFCLVRTDPAAKKQEGISFILVDMKTPGITVRPIITIDGGREVNEVFFDNVEVPAENLVGQENKGWDYAKFLLGNERTGIARVGASKAKVARIKELASMERVGDRPLIEDPRFREKLAAVEVELKALEMTQLRVVADERKREKGKQNPASSILKLKGSEIQQQLTELVMDVVGPYALPYQRDFDGRNEEVIGPDYADRGGADVLQLSQGLDLRRFQRNSAQHRREGDTGALTIRWTMDFDLTDEQRLLKDSVDRLIADQYQFEQRKKYMAEPDGWSRAALAAIRRTRPARPAVRGGAWRLRRRPGRDDDRDGGVRPRPRAGAVLRHCDPGRRPAAARSERRHSSRRCCRRSHRAS